MDFKVPVGVPRLPQAQINALSAPAAGWLVRNTTSNKLQFYDGSAWQDVATSAPLSGDEQVLLPVNNPGAGRSYRIQIYEVVDENGAINAVIQATRVP